jgi:hypothetical protein
MHLHLTLFVASLLTSLHVLQHFTTSSTTVLFQVCFSLPVLLTPCRFQSRACFSIDPSFFVSIWSVHCHFLFLICIATSFYPVASHNSSLCATSGNLIASILRKQLLTNTCNLFLICVVTFHVLHPYSNIVKNCCDYWLENNAVLTIWYFATILWDCEISGWSTRAVRTVFIQLEQ